MKELKEVFSAKLTRFNFGEPHRSYVREFTNYPTNEELITFWEYCDTTDEIHKDFESRVTIEKTYLMLPT